MEERLLDDQTDRPSAAPQEIKESFRLWLKHLEGKAFRFDGGFAICGTAGLVIACHEYEQTGLSYEILGAKSVESSQSQKAITDEESGYRFTALTIAPAEGESPVVLTVFEKGVSQITGNLFLLESLSLSLSACIKLKLEQKLQSKQREHNERLAQELRRRDYLIQVTERLHSKIDVDSVLSEVLDSIRSFFPQLEIDLFLSQEHSTRLPVKLLSFQGDSQDICTRAFMEGKIVKDSVCTALPQGRCLAAPLCGKQGVYGVLRLHASERMLDEDEVRFISLVADTAGIAFENALLYEQSNVLISELRLINEITKRLNQSLKLSEIYEFAASELIGIFGADFSCVLELDKAQQRMVVQATNLTEMYQEDFQLNYGFSGIVYQTKEPLIISDYWSHPTSKSKLMETTKSRSLIASPILHHGEVIGVIMVAHALPNYFSYDNYKLLQVLAVHIGLAMINASLHAELNRMVITDHLTNLHVRRYLDEQVNLLQKKDFCGSLIVVDIDHFKQVNDTYGHQIGDQILIQVSSIIRSSIRLGDIGARWGGEELAVYLPQVSIEQAQRIAERIRTRVFNETKPRVSVSCGVSDWNWEDDKISVESLFYKADMALYRAKHEGRNRVIIG
jgi:diguanylate cyclase (GGDEF)-like protein